MDLPLSEKDVVLVSSDFASMITIAKAFIKKLEDDAQEHADRYLEKISNTRSGTHDFLEQHMELWMRDLKTQLKEFEFHGRASTLKTFFHASNYLHTLRSPMTKISDRFYKIPVRNITFPQENANESIPVLHKSRKRTEKRNVNKKPGKNISVCGMKIIEHQ